MSTTDPAPDPAPYLEKLVAYARAAAERGASSDAIDAAARRGYMIADPRRYTQDPKDHT